MKEFITNKPIEGKMKYTKYLITMKSDKTGEKMKHRADKRNRKQLVQ